MKKLNRPILLAAVTLFTAAAFCSPASAAGGKRGASANPLSYTWLRIGGVSQESDYFDDRAQGYSLQGSWQLDENVYLLGSAARLDFDQLPGREHIYGVGIGYQENPMGDISAFLQAEVFRTRLDLPGGDRTDDWARFSWGFRALLGKDSPWELDGAVYYDAQDDFGDRDFGAWFGIGVVWDHVGLRLVGDHNGSQDTVRLGLSVYF